MADARTTKNRTLFVSALLIILGVLLGAGAMTASGGGATYIFALVVGAVSIVVGIALLAVSIVKSRTEADA